MADHLHESFSAFRETLLTALARLEFQIRDSVASSTKAAQIQPQFQQMMFDDIYKRLSSRIAELERIIQTHPPSIKEDVSDSLEKEIIKMEQPVESRNILVPSTRPTPALTAIQHNVRSTPALAAAVAAASAFPPALNLTDAESISSEDVDEQKEAEEDDASSESVLQSIVIQGKPYYMDSDMTVYEETDEGCVEIGKYDSLTDSILYLSQDDEVEVEVEGEVEEEQEEEPALEQFTWKGITYYRDSENSVYQETDEGYVEIGNWNGKKVILLE
jgi:hypothetical protein